MFEVYPELGPKWPLDGIGPVAVVLAQLPDPSSLEPGSSVLVYPGKRSESWFGRLLRRSRSAHLAVRCTALLARGYVDIRSELRPGGAVALGRVAVRRDEA